LIKIFVKMLPEMYPWTKKVTIKVWKSPVSITQ